MTQSKAPPPVWRGYDQDALDAQYDQRTLVSDLEPYVEAWRGGSDLARRRSGEVRMEIAYGYGEGERFDLYLPMGRVGPLPFIAYLHGGAWRLSMRGDSGFPARAAHRLGAAYIAIGYDAVPAVDLVTQCGQALKAWRFLAANAREFGLDPTRGHLVGHSSGAHLAAMAAFDAEAQHMPATAILLSGIYDLEPVRLSARNDYLELDAETAAGLSPIRRIPRVGPRLTIAWGDGELAEFRRQSQDFARTCQARGLDVSQFEMPGRNHFDTSLALADPNGPLYAALRRRG